PAVADPAGDRDRSVAIEGQRVELPLDLTDIDVAGLGDVASLELVGLADVEDREIVKSGRELAREDHRVALDRAAARAPGPKPAAQRSSDVVDADPGQLRDHGVDLLV